MPLNNPNAPGWSDRPRLRVLSNGIELPNAMAAQVTSNNHFQSDRFSIAFVPEPGGIGSLN